MITDREPIRRILASYERGGPSAVVEISVHKFRRMNQEGYFWSIAKGWTPRIENVGRARFNPADITPIGEARRARVS